MEKYDHYSDEKITAMYQSGDEQAIDYLLNKYKNLVRKKAKAMYLAGGDSDDLIQEGMIGLYKAIRDYDEVKEASFLTFASMCINRQLCTAVTTSNRKKYSPLNGYISLDMPVQNEMDEEATALINILRSSSEQNPEKLYIDKETADIIEQKLENILSSYERKVLQLYMQGSDYIQIAQKLEKSPKSVDNALQRIRTKLSFIV